MNLRQQHYLKLLEIDVYQLRSARTCPERADAQQRPAPTAINKQADNKQTAPTALDTPANKIPQTPPPSSPSTSTPIPVSNPAPAVDETTERWRKLRQQVEQCTACALHHSRAQPVFGVGNPTADCMIIGEAPGAEEDRLGEPFVGRAGKLLTTMLQAIKLDRQQVYIANILKSRPPNNRDPNAAEMAACWPYLLEQIELVQPRLILAMGRIAAQTLLQSQLAVGKLRGKVHHFQQIPLIVTYHPAYLLRTPVQKRKSWDDLKRARQILHAI